MGATRPRLREDRGEHSEQPELEIDHRTICKPKFATATSGLAVPDNELVILLSTSACPSGLSPGYKEEVLTWDGEEDYETGLDLWITQVQEEECSFEVEMDCDLHDVRTAPRNWQSLWLDWDDLPDEDD